MTVLATALYWIAIGVLCLGGSAVVARALRRHGHQERWVWASGLAGALVLPLVLPAVATPTFGTTAAGGLIGPAAVMDLAPLGVGVAETPSLGWLAPLLLSLWAGLSTLLLLRLVIAIRAVSRVRRDATPSRESGGMVRITRREGPAVAGLLRPVILIPEWVIALPRSRREWILRHEEEHIRGRDPWLLGLILIARIAAPWNPVVWVFGRSIRSAIETDCDRRTVDSGGDPRAYSEALIAVAGGGHGRDALPAMAPAFAERRVSLDHRIETLTRPRRRIGAVLRVALASVAVLVVGAACEMPAPTQSDDPADATEAAPSADLRDAPATGSATTGDGPRFVPYDVPPRLINARAVQQKLEQEYPPVLKEAGIGGEVIVWLHISSEGEVVDARVRDEPSGSSGHDALDAAALAVAAEMVFEPARNRGEVTPVWVQIPITYTVGRDTTRSDRPVEERDAGNVPPRATDDSTPEYVDRPVDADQPRFIPYDVPPRMKNPGEVQRTLEQEYPPLLKEAGIGGEVVVWLYISETGAVLDTQIRTDPPGTSGHDGLDAAALTVADAMEFEPAMNRDKQTAVWVQIPITFTVRN